ncbi:MAG: hypothetical protein F2735_00445 [Actinobacteria bacterium]|uniref:Unannotated protein n=1 Tax=freshwater metagenome TaxID=449393 RepID=A0A6J6WNW4_9ZZZZ|nr:hypothetical protein [Actinomycetota bacterium]
MPAKHRVALIAAVIGSLSLLGCASKEHPTVRQAEILTDTHLQVSVWCAQKAQPYVLVTETATQVRLLNQYVAPNHNCETGEDITLEAPLGIRDIVDERDGHIIPVNLDYRCGEPGQAVGRCDGIDAPVPPTFGK